MSKETNKFPELMKELFDLEPLTIYKEPSNKVDTEQYQGLAECYAKKGYRVYLENAVSLMMKEAVMNKGDDFASGLRAGRIVALKELLSVSHRAFNKLPKKK
jgi:hypothetical protein